MSEKYSFVTRWQIRAPIEKVWNAIYESTEWPHWWKGVLNVNPDISVDIEGHTDSIPIRKKYEDNWALSTARATSIVRILVNDYKVDPVRVIASGHSLYDPVDSNSTEEGRARNRRTEIILSPKLDELYKLLEQ